MIDEHKEAIRRETFAMEAAREKAAEVRAGRMDYDSGATSLYNYAKSIGCTDENIEQAMLEFEYYVDSKIPPDFVPALLGFTEMCDWNIETPVWCVCPCQKTMWKMVLASGCYWRVFVFGAPAVAKALNVSTMTPYNFIKRLVQMGWAKLVKRVAPDPVHREANQYQLTLTDPTDFKLSTYTEKRHTVRGLFDYWTEVSHQFPFLAERKYVYFKTDKHN